MQNLTDPEGEILLYQTEDGQTRIDVRLVGDDVWLTQMQMTELFQKDKRTISEHIQNVFSEGELNTGATVRNFRTVQKEGEREVSRELTYYKGSWVISLILCLSNGGLNNPKSYELYKHIRMLTKTI